MVPRALGNLLLLLLLLLPFFLFFLPFSSYSSSPSTISPSCLLLVAPLRCGDLVTMPVLLQPSPPVELPLLPPVQGAAQPSLPVAVCAPCQRWRPWCQPRPLGRQEGCVGLPHCHTAILPPRAAASRAQSTQGWWGVVQAVTSLEGLEGCQVPQGLKATELGEEGRGEGRRGGGQDTYVRRGEPHQ